MQIFRLYPTIFVGIFSFLFTFTCIASTPTVKAPSVFDNASTKSEITTNNPPPGFSDKIKLTNATNNIAILHPTPPSITANGFYLQDVYSGKELATQNPEQRMHPASLTKLMTLYLIFEALEANRIHLDDPVTISEHAWKTGGSRMFVKANSSVPVSDLIKGIIVASGNDACVAMAEYVGGTEDSFVNLMNQQAALLGMKNTHFMDCTGWPNPDHYTTPHDMAILSRAIILNFPQFYPWFAQKEFTYNKITQPNRNRLLWRDRSVDGLKTGHTDEAGFCLIASAQRNNMRLLSVLLGAPSDEARAQYSSSLLNYGFRFFETHKAYAADYTIQKIPVWYGKTHDLSAGVSHDMYITTPNSQYKNVSIEIQIDKPLKAPIQRGTKIGTVSAKLNNEIIAQDDLIALQDVERGNIFSRFIDYIKYLFNKIF